MKENAEIWNGRFAQVAIIVIIIQEAVTGKGVIQGIQDVSRRALVTKMWAMSDCQLRAEPRGAAKSEDNDYYCSSLSDHFQQLRRG